MCPTGNKKKTNVFTPLSNIMNISHECQCWQGQEIAKQREVKQIDWFFFPFQPEITWLKVYNIKFWKLELA